MHLPLQPSLQNEIGLAPLIAPRNLHKSQILESLPMMYPESNYFDKRVHYFLRVIISKFSRKLTASALFQNLQKQFSSHNRIGIGILQPFPFYWV